jgi:HD-GYP domain-containing protein (c-di-GMP phosphodiesterase class II)
MFLTALRYRKLLEYYEEEIYFSLGRRYYALLILYSSFVVLFILGAVDNLLRDASVQHLLTCVGLLLAAITMFISVRGQTGAATMLRSKFMQAIGAFVDTIDQKDRLFCGHSRQVHDIVRVFLEYLDDYPAINHERLLDAAILHDIGKVKVPDGILGKVEPLTPEEWNQLRLHPQNSKEMLDGTCFSGIGPWVQYHHERIDGSGYYGVSSEDIPLESRIIAIADAYSALTSQRAYRDGISYDDALRILKEGAGTQFDRRLVDVFCLIPKEKLAELRSL